MDRFDKYITLRNVLIFGLIVSLGVTVSEVLRDKQANFYIFKLATLDFWNGVMPYGAQWFDHGYDYYLYTPTFNVLFAPFAYMPWHLGELTWNVLSFMLFGYSIYSFPTLDVRRKARTLLYLIPILGAAQLSFQYNVAVAAMFVLAFSLLERGRGVWAVLIIMLSATTKIYGLAELALLIFYPRFWRNALFAVVFGAMFVALPLVKLSWSELVSYYGAWGDALSTHKASRSWQTVYDMQVWPWGTMRYTLMPFIQVGVFGVMSIFVLLRRKLWETFGFRVGCLAAIMGWCILFGNSSEGHTYLIALTGFLLWYHSASQNAVQHSVFVRILYFAMLVVMVLMPVDLICPPFVTHFVFNVLDLNKYLFLIAWITMVWHVMHGERSVGKVGDSA